MYACNIMAYRFFTIPIKDEGMSAAELNGFLRGHRVLSVDRRWVEQGSESFWSFCVDYLDFGGAGLASSGKNGTIRGKVDYREVLSPEDFAVFARLRQARQEIAQAEAVPVYTIFTNEQLAQMVRGRATTRAALEKIAGVGDARIEKYGGRVLEILRRQWSGEGNGTDAAGQSPL
jgi:superfamily II DNA helicase RecQ